MTDMVGRQPARWTRLALLGLLMEMAGPLLFLISAIVWGLPLDEDAIFVFVLIAVPLLGAFLVWRFGWWAKIVGIIAALLVAGAMFWTAFGLFQPSSFFDFVPGTLVIPGAFIAIFSCIAAIVAGRRGHTGTRVAGGEKTAIRGILGLVLLLAVISAILTFTGRSTVSDAAASGPAVSMKDNQFSDRDLVLGQGESLLLRNDDPFFHTFTVDDLGIDESFTPGDETLVRIPDEPGTYIFYCLPHTGNPDDPDEDDMAGTLTIE